MNGANGGQTYVRRNIWSLEATQPWDAVTLAYARAVAEMQQRPADDPTSWTYQAAMHGTYASVPTGADWNQCQHASWFFPPWHRMYVYYLERIVREIVVSQGGPADWALPYWNYTADAPANTLPPAFRQQVYHSPTGTAPNPLYTDRRAPGINSGAGLPRRQTSYEAAFRYINFSGLPTPGFGGGASPPVQFSHYTGALENQPHNIVHDLVGGASKGECGGGWMSDPFCAAQDPIFWLHHTNIDRLWTSWLDLGGGRADPVDRRWLNQTYNFYDENGKPVSMSVADVLDTVTQLGYTYDDQPSPAVSRRSTREAMTVPAPPPSGPPRLLAASDSGVTLSGRRTTLAVPLPEPARAALRSGPPESAGLGGGTVAAHLSLDVEGVQADEHPGVVYEVHLNLPPDADPATDDTFLAGTITFFGSRHHEPGEPAEDRTAGITHTFDITDRVQQLEAAGRWDGSQVTVTFVPVGLVPPPGTAGSAYDVEPASAPRVGRVSIRQTT